jgi:hypothetical protein
MRTISCSAHPAQGAVPLPPADQAIGCARTRLPRNGFFRLDRFEGRSRWPHRDRVGTPQLRTENAGLDRTGFASRAGRPSLAARPWPWLQACRASVWPSFRGSTRPSGRNALAKLTRVLALPAAGLSDRTVAAWSNPIPDGRRVLRADWYVAALAGLASRVTVPSISPIGQGLNDWLHPRLKRR